MKRILLAIAMLMPSMASAQIELGTFMRGQTIPILFPAYNVTNGASITITGIATTDIEIYKGVDMVQRGSDSGFALVDTDGIDLDGRTGFHGFSLDTSDDTTAGFWEPGGTYTVALDNITINTQTVIGVWKFKLDPKIFVYGTSQATDSNTSTCDLPASYENDFENNDLRGKWLTIESGAGSPVSRLITGYDDANARMTLDEALVTDCTTTSIVMVENVKVSKILVDGSDRPVTNVQCISDDCAAADNLELLTETGGPGLDMSASTIGTATALGTNAVNATSVADGAIDAAAVATGTVDADAIADGAIDPGAVASGTFDADAVADGAIDSGAVATGAIDSDALASTAVQEMWDHLIDGGFDAEEIMCYLSAILVNKSDYNGTNLSVFRNQADTQDRVTVTYAGSDRTDVVVLPCGN